MMLIGATFAMRYTKFNQAGLLILTSVLVGFILFSLERIAITLGEAQQIQYCWLLMALPQLVF